MGCLELGIRLKQARETAKLTQAEACTTADIPKVQTLSAYERGVNSPPIDILKKLSKLYTVSTDWLLFGETPTTRKEKAPRDYMEQLVEAADYLGLNVDFWDDCGINREEVIALKLGPSSYNGIASFAHKWSRIRGLLDSNTIELSEYELLINGKLKELVLTKKSSDAKATPCNDGAFDLPF